MARQKKKSKSAEHPVPQRVRDMVVSKSHAPISEMIGRISRIAGRWWRQGIAQVKVQRREKMLRVRETISFGEKRFVAIVEVGGSQYLLGGTANSLGLLTTLKEQQPSEFASVLEGCTPKGVFIQ